MMQTLRSHTHLQATQIQAQTKAYKRVCLPQRINGRRNNEDTTICKNNSRDSGLSKVCSPLQLSCNSTVMKPAIGYYSYTNRCCT